MSASKAYLPNGQKFDVIPVFGGFSFKSTNLTPQQGVLPPGWTIVIHTEKPRDGESDIHRSRSSVVPEGVATNIPTTTTTTTHKERPHQTHHYSWSVGRMEEREERDSPKTYRFTKPTLHNDYFYISSISMPSNDAFKPASSPTRQIAMLVWATLWWYFHLPEPNPHLPVDPSSRSVPEGGLPKGDWRINIKRDGVFKGRNLLQKLERMGLITNEDSSVGPNSSELGDPTGWSRMFSSRRGFWQMDARIFLFTLSPANASPFPSSPRASRPASPTNSHSASPRPDIGPTSSPLESLNNTVACYGGPFTSGSHLPTYFPPPPLHYVVTDGIRHPMRQKPPRQGEVFYVRYIPSVEQFLSFRVPILSAKDNQPPHTPCVPSMPSSIMHAHSSSPSPSCNNHPSDLEILHKWMNNDRVNAAWGVAGPQASQERFLRNKLSSRNSFPVIGCWDNKPFGYFEIYWVKEDPIARHLPGHVDNWDRGLHCLVGEEEFRGPHRVSIWLSALVHYCWLADMRTQTVLLEPRVDNEKFISHLQTAGFYKEGEVSFPHKQAAIMKTKRDFWEAPVL
ncbi:hypothetical protein FQN54_005616 [Arachnomyces sp. PD_36]|nr:hypothetical protein FQN54_005616 [Arachnomyces sp. PD_36]